MYSCTVSRLVLSPPTYRHRHGPVLQARHRPVAILLLLRPSALLLPPGARGEDGAAVPAGVREGSRVQGCILSKKQFRIFLPHLSKKLKSQFFYHKKSLQTLQVWSFDGGRRACLNLSAEPGQQAYTRFLSDLLQGNKNINFSPPHRSRGAITGGVHCKPP